MDAEFTRWVTKIKRRDGVAAAKTWAEQRGYAVRWDRDGNLYIRDLLMGV